jgi:hypothetical protein
MSITTFCLDCERIIDLGPDPQVGQRVKCAHCEVELEIINLEPLELDWIYERNSQGLDFEFLEEGDKDKTFYPPPSKALRL